MNRPGIYQIKNIANGKVYIGSSCNIKSRFIRHKTELNHNKHGNKYLQRSYNKYGASCFEFSVIELCDIDSLIINEQKWIDKLKSSDIGYNLRPIANSNRGFKHSEESKLKISKANIGRITSQETRMAQSLAQRGKRLSPETKLKLSIANRGKRPSVETRKKLSIALSGRNIGNTYKKGHKISDKHRAILSAANKGKIHSASHREKNAIAHTGKKASIQTREKMAASHKGSKHSHETKLKLSQTLKGRVISVEQREIARKNTCKQFSDISSREKHSDIMKSYYKSNPRSKLSQIKADVGLALSWAKRQGRPFSMIPI